MEYLRSSAGYHLDLDEHSLRRHFGVDHRQISLRKKHKKSKKEKRSSFTNVASKNGQIFTKDYERPRLDIFNQHCDYVVKKYGLDHLHTRGLVTTIEPTDNHVKVAISLLDDDGKRGNIIYTAQNVILALGNDEPTYADWVDEDDLKLGLVEHLFDEQNTNARDSHCQKVSSFTQSQGRNQNEISDVAVIGGGISAAHKALELVRIKQSPITSSTSTGIVHMISRHALQVQQFDTHQDWMMDRAASKRSEDGGGTGTPKCQKRFASSSSLKQRRMLIAKERVPGTITPAIHRGNDGLCYAIENGDIRWHQAEVLAKRILHGERIRMELSLSCGDTIEVDKVLLATGFGTKRPGGKLIQDLVENIGLKVSEFCGFPICNENLAWHPRIYVSGALAELELGPSARNIAGARLGAERILETIKARL